VFDDVDQDLERNLAMLGLTQCRNLFDNIAMWFPSCFYGFYLVFITFGKMQELNK
jgi:hypothetical protein